MPKNAITRQGGTVRLTLPAKVANDLPRLQRSLRAIADRLGHPACFTGCDMFFANLEEQFAFSDKVELNPQPLPPRGPIDLQARNLVTVSMPDKINGDIEALTRAVGNVVGKLGCTACCSGFDILFRREINTISLDERGEVARFGGVG